MAFFAAIEQFAGESPPVHRWNPPLCGELDLLIQSTGEWLMEGRPIARQRLIQLYASVLKYEDGEYYLVTPVEKWRITVEDLPFLVVDIHEQPVQDQQRKVISCQTNMGDVIAITEQNPLEVSDIPGSDGVRVPKILVRDQLWARFNRQSYYDWVDLCTVTDDDRLSFISGHYQQILSL